MQYLRSKYDGLSQVSVNYIKHELLLSDYEFLAIKREVAKMTECKHCPEFISFGLFESLVESHL